MWQYIGSTSGADTGVGGMSETPEVLISGDEGTHLGRCGRARAEPIWELRLSHLGIAAEPVGRRVS